MKGWYGESLRHSLAARGIIGKYLYHGTTNLNVKDIKRLGGLVPGYGLKVYSVSEDYIYLAPTEKTAQYWADKAKDIQAYDYRASGPVEPVLLRMDKDKLREYGGLIFDPQGTEEYWPYIEKDESYYISPGAKFALAFDGKLIPLEIIEIKTKEGWRSLK